MQTIINLQKHLDDIRCNVMGIAIFSICPPTFDLVINTDKETTDTIHISPWGSIQSETVSTNTLKEGAEIVLFPDGKTLGDMLKNPFDFQDFCNKYLNLEN